MSNQNNKHMNYDIAKLEPKTFAKAKAFMASHPNGRVFVYEYGIPTGAARTKGYGLPKEIIVVLAGENFKTRNSPHVVLEGATYFRADYGTIKGHCAKIREEYKNIAEEWKTYLFN